MKLIIQIPCYNEEKTLPITIADLPTNIDGIDIIEILIINDGSTDETVNVAKSLGVHHIVSFAKNKGLSKGFMTGIDTCLQLGADIIVNTDGDNQYSGENIPQLIQPLLDGKAEIVIGDRQTDNIESFSWVKKKLQKLGSWVVRVASTTQVNDTASGFRAFTRDAAMKLIVLNDYSYTLETIINAGRQKVVFENVPINTNEKLRESRLFKNIQSYLGQAISTIIRSYAQIKSLKLFLIVSSVFSFFGLAIMIRYLFYFINGDGNGHLQSLLLGVLLIILAIQSFFFGLLADSISANRKINEELLYRIKKIEYNNITIPSFKEKISND